jgi:hypothetical protein
VALLTAGAVAGAIGVVWRMRFVPISFYKYWKTPPAELAVGQVWAYASFFNRNAEGDPHTYTITEVDQTHVVYQSNWIPDEPDLIRVQQEVWDRQAKKLRCFVLNVKGATLEDQFWGDAAE